MPMEAVRGWGGLIAMLGLLGAPMACADDVTTLSGATYREVRAVRVEPDGVTWEHATGMVKVDFTDLPDPVRKAYHYDAAKAAAFQAAQARAREESAAQAQRAQKESEARRVQLYQAQAGGMETRPGEFVVRRKAAEAAAVGSVGEGIVAKKQAEAFRTKDDGTMWDRRLWAVPKYIFGGNEFDGVAFNPKTDFNSHEFQSTVHHSPVSEVKDTVDDAFFKPNYSTKSYYDDVDRAAAFARGRP